MSRHAEFVAERERYIDRLEERFAALYSSDRGPVLELIRAGLRFGLKDPDAEHRIALLDSHLISERLFEALLCGGESFKPLITADLWDHMVKSRMALRTMRPDLGAFADFQLDPGLLLGRLSDGTFRNLFAPQSALYTRYAPAVVAVDVVTSDGDLSRGSGFLARVLDDGPIWLVTAKHNVDPGDGVAEVLGFTSAAGQPVSVGAPYLSPSYDIAVYRPSEQPAILSLVFARVPAVFEEVFTLGFPKVPRAQSTLLGHRGEVNATVDLYQEGIGVILISNLVAPGSSGCPVLSRDGRCVGMTTMSLEERDKPDRFSAALPAELILTVIAEASRHI